LLSPALFAAVMFASSTPDSTPAALRYLALGDSYTIGEAVDPAQRWPVRLAEALSRDGIPLQPPRIIATTGWTTDELGGALDAVEPLGKWDFVSLLIGVNDQYRGRPASQFRSAFAELLERSISLASGHPQRVLVLTIPDWGVTPFGAASGRDRAQIAQQLDAYNQIVLEESTARGVSSVDIAAVSRSRGAEPGMVAADGLHPSAALYAEWTALALPVAHQLLSSEN
jgi:lysophospholipase L1-like esterase